MRIISSNTKISEEEEYAEQDAQQETESNGKYHYFKSTEKCPGVVNIIVQASVLLRLQANYLASQFMWSGPILGKLVFWVYPMLHAELHKLKALLCIQE